MHYFFNTFEPIFQIALQTAGVVSGLPYAFIILLLCRAVWVEVQVAAGDIDPFGPKFSVGLFDPFGAEPFKLLSKKKKPTLKLLYRCVINIFLAPWTVAKSASRLEQGHLYKQALTTVPLFVLSVILFILELAAKGCWAIGLICYLGFAISITRVRLNVREKFKIDGNVFEDFFAALFFYPSVAVQLDEVTKDTIESK